MEGLQQLLQDNGTVKIMHDCRQAAAVLFYERGVTIQNVFDTQVLSKKRTAKLMCTDQKNMSARDAMPPSPFQLMHDCCRSFVSREKVPVSTLVLGMNDSGRQQISFI